jgi:hypothetical protein
MTGPDSCAIIAMEILIEEKMVAPVRVFLKLLCAAEYRAGSPCPDRPTVASRKFTDRQAVTMSGV